MACDTSSVFPRSRRKETKICWFLLPSHRFCLDPHRWGWASWLVSFPSFRWAVSWWNIYFCCDVSWDCWSSLWLLAEIVDSSRRGRGSDRPNTLLLATLNRVQTEVQNHLQPLPSSSIWVSPSRRQSGITMIFCVSCPDRPGTSLRNCHPTSHRSYCVEVAQYLHALNHNIDSQTCIWNYLEVEESLRRGLERILWMHGVECRSQNQPIVENSGLLEIARVEIGAHSYFSLAAFQMKSLMSRLHY